MAKSLRPPETLPSRRVGNVEVTLNEEGLVESIQLDGRTLVLTNDPRAIRTQLQTGAGQADFAADEALVGEVSTDAIIMARPDCYFQGPEMGEVPLRSLKVGGEEPIGRGDIQQGTFAALAAGSNWGRGSSREHAAQALMYAGIGVIYAPTIAPIHRANLINNGMFPVFDRVVMERLMQGEQIPVGELLSRLEPIEQRILLRGGLFRFLEACDRGDETLPVVETEARPMTIVERILARHMTTRNGAVKPGDFGAITADVTLCHDYTTEHAAKMVEDGLGRPPQVKSPERHHSFPDHLTLMQQAARAALGFGDRPGENISDEEARGVKALRDGQRKAAEALGIHFHVRPDSEVGGATGICHQVFRERVVEPGQVVVGTDSHTCSSGFANAYAFGVGSSGISTAWEQDLVLDKVPPTIRVEFTGQLPAGVSGKDVMLVLAGMTTRQGVFTNSVIEFGGEGLASMTADDQYVLANMATECSAVTGIVEPNAVLEEYLVTTRGMDRATVQANFVYPDEGAQYKRFVTIDLSSLVPQVATPGNTGNNVPLSQVAGQAIDRAYIGSCTAGSLETLHQVAQVVKGHRVEVETLVQPGSIEVLTAITHDGTLAILEAAGVKVIREPGCGACLAAGPGGPQAGEHVLSATNRNFPGRMGRGNASLANPRVVAAGAVLGHIPTLEEYGDLVGLNAAAQA